MPTYEYECSDCAHIIEIFHGIWEEPDTQCPKCGCQSLRKLIGSGAGVIFKGSGFYRNDSQKASSRETSSGGDAAPKKEAPSKKEPSKN